MRSNKDPGLESRSFVIDKERVQSLDTNKVHMSLFGRFANQMKTDSLL